MTKKSFFALLMAICMGLSMMGCGNANAAMYGFDDEPEPESRPFLFSFVPAGKATKPEPVTPVEGAIAQAKYPEIPVYPQESAYTQKNGSFDYESYQKAYALWQEYDQNRPEVSQEEVQALAPFFKAGVRQFLKGSENRVCSPVNIYMALAMLSALTAGNSQAQILQLLDAQDADALRGQANRIWNLLYTDDGSSTLTLGSSLWLNEKVPFHTETLKKLAESFYASSYAGKMGSAEFDAALQSWLNEQTRGLLSEQASGVKMDAETVLALATAMYFKSNWIDQFQETNTDVDIFHAEDGDRKALFMHQTETGTIWHGDGFSAFRKPMHNGGMWLILPDEGKTPADLLNNDAAMDFLTSSSGRQQGMRAEVTLSLPKFDVISDLDLIDGLKAMGVTDVFNSAASDFSPMTSATDSIEISQAKHAARVKIDEEGCEAAAYTVMMAEATAAMEPPPQVLFTLDRPFLFAVTADAGLPLFVGAVQTPLDV